GLLRLPDAGCTRLADGRGLESPGNGRNRRSSSTVSNGSLSPSTSYRRLERAGLLPIWPIFTGTGCLPSCQAGRSRSWPRRWLLIAWVIVATLVLIAALQTTA